MAGKEIDRNRARGAVDVIKQHPLMVLFVLSPGLLAVALVWWLAGAGWGILLLLALMVGGAFLVVRRR